MECAVCGQSWANQVPGLGYLTAVVLLYRSQGRPFGTAAQ